MAYQNPNFGAGGGVQMQPITNQPGMQPPPDGNWMQMPQAIPNCPPGLEYLTQVDQILCHQIVELLQAFTGWETNNKYSLKNSMGQQIYYVFEETDMCMRICCKNQRSFILHIVNNYNQEVMRIHRPFKCCAGCCWFADSCMCCSHETFVEAPPGNLIASIRQTGAPCSFTYEVADKQGETQMQIKGPCCCCMCKCICDVEFPVYSKDGTTQIGMVTKQWGGCVKECFTAADNFGVQFPMDLSVELKAGLLGAMFLIDFMAFENQSQ